MLKRDHVEALIRVELRRVYPMALRMAGIVGGLLLLFIVFGKGDAENISAVLVGSTFGYIVLVPVAFSRDKIDGGLEFLCFLPTTPREIASARVAVAAIIACPGALQIALAFAIYGTRMYAVPNAPTAALILFLFAWSALTAASCVMLALISNFRLQTLLGMPLIAVGILLIGVPAVVRRFEAPINATLSGTVQHDNVLLAVAAFVVLLILGTLAITYVATVRGIATYRHGRDQI